MHYPETKETGICINRAGADFQSAVRQAWSSHPKVMVICLEELHRQQNLSGSSAYLDRDKHLAYAGRIGFLLGRSSTPAHFFHHLASAGAASAAA